MIRINLQMFAKSSSQMQAYRKSIAMSKYSHGGGKSQQEQSSGPNEKRVQERQPERRTTVSNAVNVTSVNSIKSRENYVLYQIDDKGNEREYGTRSGAQLRDSIADEKLTLDKKTKTWRTSKHRYIIRKRGR